ncbi:hypothetical protein NDU88_003230 [Pleurodeles waltl]|uniref:Uncharacterized protein n=1 Tax=Pleurodeles waltl TaxID=8319 RepID=A0AAV7LI80_PLEWA|nr:hypothetical protein NDU88_003230 [Pleurodeles waltl]
MELGLNLRTFCKTDRGNILLADNAINAVYICYFGLRFVAAEDTLRFWLELNSIVDFFTITPTCAEYFMGKNIIGELPVSSLMTQ